VKITNLDHEEKFTQMLTSLLDEHRHVVSMLADGFCQSRDYIEVSSTEQLVPCDPVASSHWCGEWEILFQLLLHVRYIHTLVLVIPGSMLV